VSHECRTVALASGAACHFRHEDLAEGDASGRRKPVSRKIGDIRCRHCGVPMIARRASLLQRTTPRCRRRWRAAENRSVIVSDGLAFSVFCFFATMHRSLSEREILRLRAIRKLFSLSRLVAWGVNSYVPLAPLWSQSDHVLNAAILHELTNIRKSSRSNYIMTM
jgi:hypothetical protein